MNQHRRDLNTNELEKIAAKAKPFLEEHLNKIIYAVCGILLVATLYFTWDKSWSGGDPAGWEEFLSATRTGTAEDFGKVAEKYPDKPVGQWALLNEAELYLNQGIRASFTDRKGAVSDLEASREKFEKLLSFNSLPPRVEERALYGLSRCLESTSGDDTDRAIKSYDEFLRRFPDSPFASRAKNQIEILKSEEGKEFYAWFAKQDPKPEDRKLPNDGLPPGHPSIDPATLIRLPNLPDGLKLPDDDGPKGTAADFPDDENGIPAPPPLPEDDKPTGTAPPVPE
jgi:tetratricopeptide (TPR) repeat protein